MDSNGVLSDDGKKLWRHLLQHAANPPIVPFLTITNIQSELNLDRDAYTGAIHQLRDCAAVRDPNNQELQKLTQLRRIPSLFVVLLGEEATREYIKVLTPAELQQATVAIEELTKRDREAWSSCLIDNVTEWSGTTYRLVLNDFITSWGRTSMWFRKDDERSGLYFNEFDESAAPSIDSYSLTDSDQQLLTSTPAFNFGMLARDAIDRAQALDEAHLRFRALSQEHFLREKQRQLASLASKLEYCRRLSEAIEVFERERLANRRGHIPERVRREVWQRDGGRCVECGSQYDLEYDHIIAVVNGGSTTARNLRLLCQRCNRSKGAGV